MKRKRVIVWFREDLRLHDNEALTDALKAGEEVIPIYVFDERTFSGKTSFGFQKTGSFRTQFIIEAVHDLRKSLRKLGSDLFIRVGKPEDEIFKIAEHAKTSWVFCNRERTQEEVRVQDALEKNLWSIGQEIVYSRGKMLYYTADLPFPVTHTPDIFTSFRKEVEKYVPVRAPLPTPTAENFKPLTTEIQSGKLPGLEDFGHDKFEKDPNGVMIFEGGETAAMAHLQEYFWEKGLAHSYKETRNGLLGKNYSTKFSVFLAHGCISPKYIYQELKKFEQEKGKNKSTYWIFFELLWRDFFRLMGKKYGNKIFQYSGTQGNAPADLHENLKLFQLWVEGKTGVPFIDANMQEIARTGFMSNRGRQNVASFLVKDLRVNWLMGAEYFESMLIDYDPCSNYGNWNYIAGVGSDPREDRYFNILTQARRYDPKGEYVKHWLPALRYLPADKVHSPEKLSRDEQKKMGVTLGADYPIAMINTSKWRKSY